MAPKLPPPDPHETYDLAPTGDHGVAAPTAVFVGGPASPEADHVASGFLDLRPGLLIVFS